MMSVPHKSEKGPSTATGVRRHRWDGRALVVVAVVLAVAGGVFQALGLDGILWVLVTAAIGAPLAVFAATRERERRAG